MLSIVAFVLVARRRRCRSARWPPARTTRTSSTASPLLLLPEAEHLAAEPLRTASSIGLADIPLVAALSEDARVALAEASRRLVLDAGEWLFREGDPPGSAYLLRSGRLEVVQGDRLLRTLTPGGVVGELVAAHRRAAVGRRPGPPGRDAHRGAARGLRRAARPRPAGRPDRADPGGGPDAHRRDAPEPASAPPSPT